MFALEAVTQSELVTNAGTVVNGGAEMSLGIIDTMQANPVGSIFVGIIVGTVLIAFGCYAVKKVKNMFK